jgi:predicted membrane-bound spermidine synthase
VATTGAAVMMIEVLGTRVIAPFYGVGLFVWTALIAVALVALAIGYRIGGTLADRKGSGWLSTLIAGAAVLTALIPLLRSPVLQITDPLGLRLGSLACAFILFAGPLTLLGMVGPYVVRMRAERIDSVGVTAGSIFAVSTFGSVVGTLLTGFVLLPAFGTRSILVGLAVGLIVLAGIVRLGEKRKADTRLAAAVLVVAIAATLGAGLARPGSGSADGRFQVLFDAESTYGRVRVVDDTQQRYRMRWMLVDASAIGAVFTETNEAVFPYLFALETLGEFRPAARSALVIGLGAGYLPGALAKQGIAVDLIEIDPAVVRAAREHFGFVSPGELIVGDARYEVRKITKKYDLIVHDCFTGGEMPWHLFSAEMLHTLHQRLNDGGILALNFFGLAEPGRVDPLTAVAATLDREFPHRLTLAPSPGSDLFDRLFLVSDRAVTLPAGAPARNLSIGARNSFERLGSLVTEMPAAHDLIVTDDHNPLELLQLRKGEKYRQIMLSQFTPELLAQ